MIHIYHTGLISSISFQNHAFKGCLSLESGNYKIVAISTDKTLILMTLIIKLTLVNISIKVKNLPGGATVTR